MSHTQLILPIDLLLFRNSRFLLCGLRILEGGTSALGNIISEFLTHSASCTHIERKNCKKIIIFTFTYTHGCCPLFVSSVSVAKKRTVLKEFKTLKNSGISKTQLKTKSHKHHLNTAPYKLHCPPLHLDLA